MSMKPQKVFAYTLAGLFGIICSVVVIGILVSFFSGDDSATHSPDGSQSDAEIDIYDQASDSSPPMERQEATGNQPKVLDDYPDHGGKMVARTPDGRKLALPSIKSDYHVDIRGDLATVTVEQRFKNPGDVPLNALYQFPLSEEAAVYEMIMRVGNEQIRADIQKKNEAKKTYQKAKKAGKSAALLEQHRPNLFTQKVANLMPNKPVDVTLRYVATVDKIDGRYQVVVPLVVGPRYTPADMSDNFLVDDDAAGSDGSTAGSATDRPSSAEASSSHKKTDKQALPPSPPVSELDAPETIDADRVSVDVRIDGGVPVRNIKSSHHAIDTVEFNPRDWRVTLAKGRTVANKHFVLSYSLDGDSTDAGVLSFWDDQFNEGYFSMLIEPPAEPADADIVNREMVFVLDCSGSMHGQPMNTSKTYMRYALHNLRPTDHFRIIRFSDGATEYSTKPIVATDDHVAEAIAHLNNLDGRGGTSMKSGIEQALDVPVPDDTVRIVTFLTDGYISNDFAVIRLLGDKIGQARLFALGVGRGANRYLLDEMGRMGRGFTKYIDPKKNVVDQARHLADRLQTPVLTDISVDWGELRPRELTPEKIPDLFAGQSVRVMGRYQKPGTYTVHVHGASGARAVTIPMEVTLPAKTGDGKAVELTWARQTIKDYMHTLTTPDRLRHTEITDDQIEEIVTNMGLDYALATQWTSFVAVSEKVVNPHPSNAANGQVPQSQVDGVTNKAYGKRAPSHPQFGAATAHGTPEPATWAGLLVVLLAGLWGLRDRWAHSRS